MEIRDGEITQSMRQGELQKIAWDNSLGGRMEEWNNQRKSLWNNLNICQQVTGTASPYYQLHTEQKEV